MYKLLYFLFIFLILTSEWYPLINQNNLYYNFRIKCVYASENLLHYICTSISNDYYFNYFINQYISSTIMIE